MKPCIRTARRQRRYIPSRKKGAAELKGWIIDASAVPEFKKPFLIQMAWADMLSKDELSALFTKYEKEIETQLTHQKEMYDRQKDWPNRSQKETFCGI